MESFLNNMSKKDIMIGVLITAVVFISIFAVVMHQPSPEIDDTVNSSDVDTNKGINSAVLNNTVTIYSENENTIGTSQGSGFIYNDEYIITNEHVIRNQDSINVRYRSGIWTEAKVVGSDKHTDIAVLKPDKVPDLNQSLLLMKDNPDVGSSVVAVGSPYNLRNSLSEGIISGTDRNIRIGTKYSISDSIQTDAQLNPGNSGGPLVIESTNVVVGVNRAVVDGIGFSVSSKVTDNVAREIIENGTYNHARIGITGENVNKLEYEVTGVRITRLLDTENLQGTELEASDEDKDVIITQIDNRTVKDIEDISSYILFNKSPDDSVKLKLNINGETEYVTVELTGRK